MPETVQAFPGLYPLGSGVGVSLPTGNVLISGTLNTRDIYSGGAPDYVLLGPGSEVWYVGYSFRIQSTAPTNPLDLVLLVQGSYDVVVPFIFGTEQSLILPVYAETVEHYAGRARIESPVAQLELVNNTGDNLTVSYQFWGKAL